MRLLIRASGTSRLPTSCGGHRRVLEMPDETEILFTEEVRGPFLVRVFLFSDTEKAA